MQSETLKVQGEAIPTAVVPVLVEATSTAAVVLAVAASSAPATFRGLFLRFASKNTRTDVTATSA